jgi:hypothetical protein
MRVKFVYEGSLAGSVLHNYGKPVNGHYIWFSGLSHVLRASNMSNSRIITQIVEVDTYGKHDTQLVIQPMTEF